MGAGAVDRRFYDLRGVVQSYKADKLDLADSLKATTVLRGCLDSA